MSFSYLGKRAVIALITAVIAVAFNFAIVRSAPGNYVSYVIGTHSSVSITEAQRHALTKEYGLDASIFVQFKDYVGQLIRGNLGVSFADGQPVAGKIFDALQVTIPMLVTGVLLGILLGIVCGLLAAAFRGERVDAGIVGFTSILYSLPVQFLGVLLLLVFAGRLPIGGRQDPFLVNPSFATHQLDVLRHMILPCSTLALVIVGGYTLIVRSSILRAMSEDYVLTARSKGLGNWRIMVFEVLPNAILPIVTLIALSIGSIVGGALIIEVVFSWPGVGSLAYNAITTRDYPVIEGTFLVITLGIVFCNFLADVLYSVLDPRVRT
jgi:ABC-type dipeptide/oligopeptide/nickel transport system permease component